MFEVSLSCVVRLCQREKERKEREKRVKERKVKKETLSHRSEVHLSPHKGGTCVSTFHVSQGTHLLRDLLRQPVDLSRWVGFQLSPDFRYAVAFVCIEEAGGLPPTGY